ncbi:hypothetical protein J1614_006711 [Plenodomus biglobosus]|nr:hypothetical protein J1614_006711 [Plenodomus biglobosus]
MSNVNSPALIPTGGRNQAFQQQGSLDWVALGNMQYSMSIAILGRLAKAGIDTLTVAFGQAICRRLPIGAHGEKVLREAMSRLTVRSCAADLLWFGIGVRHILHDLVQTSQGCALITLCAALTEGHSISVSALVMYEIAKECGGPQELAPSFEQWEALVRVAAAIFGATTFGLRVHQIAQFGTPLSGGSRSNTDPPHASDLAKVLVSIGQIVQGDTQTITVEGGLCCSWIAAWADFVLGLRVLVRDPAGNAVYANYDSVNTFAQVNIHFLGRTTNNDVLCTQSSHLVRSGREFINQCFRRDPMLDYNPSRLSFFPGRLPWETMFFDTFGDSFAILVSENAETTMCPPPDMNGETPPRYNNFDSANSIFVRILATTVLVHVAKSSTLGTGSASLYLLRLCENIPELRQCKEQVLSEMAELLSLYGTEDTLLDCPMGAFSSPRSKLIPEEFRPAQTAMEHLCTCPDHQGRKGSHLHKFCLVKITDTIIYMGLLVERTVLDTPLMPTVFGIYRLYEMSKRDRKWKFLDNPVMFNAFNAFNALVALFSGEEWNIRLGGVNARSDGRVYCYLQILERLTDNFQVASQMHVGSGQIQYRNRVYRTLSDATGRSELLGGYPARHTHTINTDDHLTYDTTTGSITAQILVKDYPLELHIYHQVTSDAGRVLIAPGAFLLNLQRANDYKHEEKLPLSDKAEWESVLRSDQNIVVHGEGSIDLPQTCHTLRPHRGNILGRCVAIAQTEGRMALVTTDEDIELFARVWAKQRIDRISAQNSPEYYSLIS